MFVWAVEDNAISVGWNDCLQNAAWITQEQEQAAKHQFTVQCMLDSLPVLYAACLAHLVWAVPISPTGVVAKYCYERVCVCVCVCVFVCHWAYLPNHMHNIY